MTRELRFLFAKADFSFRRITIGKVSFDRKSQQAVDQPHERLEVTDLYKVWAHYQATVYQRARS